MNCQVSSFIYVTSMYTVLKVGTWQLLPLVQYTILSGLVKCGHAAKTFVARERHLHSLEIEYLEGSCVVLGFTY